MLFLAIGASPDARERPSVLDAPAQLLQLAPHRTRPERVAEDGADQQRRGDVDDVFEGHGLDLIATGLARTSRARHSPVWGSLAIAFCSSLMRFSTLRVLRQVWRMKSTVHNHIST